MQRKRFIEQTPPEATESRLNHNHIGPVQPFLCVLTGEVSFHSDEMSPNKDLRGSRHGCQARSRPPHEPKVQFVPMPLAGQPGKESGCARGASAKNGDNHGALSSSRLA